MRKIISLLIAWLGMVALTGCGHPKITQTPRDENYRPLASWVLADSGDSSIAANARRIATPVRVDQSQPGVVHIAYSVREDAERYIGRVHEDQIVFRTGIVGALNAVKAEWGDGSARLVFDQPYPPRVSGVRSVSWVQVHDLVPPPEGVETGGLRVFWLAYFGDLPKDGSSFDLVVGERPVGQFVPLGSADHTDAPTVERERGTTAAFGSIDSSLRLHPVLNRDASDGGWPPTVGADLTIRRVPVPPLGDPDDLLHRWMRQEGLVPAFSRPPPGRWSDLVNPVGFDIWSNEVPWPGIDQAGRLDEESIDVMLGRFDSFYGWP